MRSGAISANGENFANDANASVRVTPNTHPYQLLPARWLRVSLFLGRLVIIMACHTFFVCKINPNIQRNNCLWRHLQRDPPPAGPPRAPPAGTPSAGGSFVGSLRSPPDFSPLKSIGWLASPHNSPVFIMPTKRTLASKQE